MTAHHLNLARPSPDRIIEAHRPRQPEPADHGTLKIAVGLALFVVMLALVWLDGIPRAFERPEACRNLSAVECTAKLQESRK